MEAAVGSCPFVGQGIFLADQGLFWQAIRTIFKEIFWEDSSNSQNNQNISENVDQTINFCFIKVFLLYLNQYHHAYKRNDIDPCKI